jgi:hypothetical protein
LHPDIAMNLDHPSRLRKSAPCAALAILLFASAGVEADFFRGDSNQDGAVDISDAAHVLNFLFSSEPLAVLCEDAADSNDDGSIDISDPLALLTFLFTGAAGLPPPGATSCGEDPTADDLSCDSPCPAGVGKWRRKVISLSDDSVDGNPFEVEVEGIFTHTESGASLVMPGYHDGDGRWEIGFMPVRQGEWTYVTRSEDADLDGHAGRFDCVDSGLPGLLGPDTTHPRKWRLADGPHVVPLSFRFDVFQEEGSLERFTEIADFLENGVKGHALEFTLRNDVYDDWRARQFDLPLWNRLEARMEVLAARGLGIHVMFYSDDDQEPEWPGESPAEVLLLRHAVARLAGYPIVIFNTGIDIAEYRDRAWVDWFGRQIREIDPYDHPISSRYGGGSGPIVMAGQTFDSRGDRLAIIGDMTSYFESSTVPVSMDDAWSENSREAAMRDKDFTEHDIRRAVWKCVVAGGLGALVRGSNLFNEDTWFRMADFEDDLESEQFLRLVNPFLETELGETFGSMVPDDSLVANGYCLADPGRTRLLYMFMGVNDSHDPEDGGDLTARLSGLSGAYSGFWFDPRTGQRSSIGTLAGGSDHVLAPPSQDDWILLLTKGP